MEEEQNSEDSVIRPETPAKPSCFLGWGQRRQLSLTDIVWSQHGLSPALLFLGTFKDAGNFGG